MIENSENNDPNENTNVAIINPSALETNYLHQFNEQANDKLAL